MWIGIVYLAVLAMFRGVNVGNDTHDYRLLFYRIAKQSDIWTFMKNTSFESGYVFANHVLSHITDNPQIIYIVFSAFAFISTGCFFSRYSKLPNLSVYLFFSLMTFDFYLSGIRQMIAISIILFAYSALINGKFIKYCCIVIIASLFHSSALIFIPLYFLLNVKERKYFFKISIGVTIGCFVGFNYLYRIFSRIFIRYENYSGSSYVQAGAKLSVILYFIVYIVVLVFGELVKEKEFRGYTDKNDEIAYRLTCLLPMICIISLNAPVFTRFLRYFQLFLYIYYPNVLLKKSYDDKNTLLILSLILFALYALTIHIMRTPEWYTTYPYSFFWSNKY